MSIFDIIVLAVMLFALVRGAITGLMKQLGIILGVIFALLFTKLLSPFVGEFVSWITSGKTVLEGTLLYAIVFVTIVLLTHLIAILIHKTTKALKIAWIDRLGGAIFSCAKYLVIASIMLNLYVGGYKAVYDKEPEPLQGESYKLVLEVAPAIMNFAGEYGISFGD